jgi:hypothetical protein
MKTYDLTLDTDKINIILTALSKAYLPWEVTNAVILDIQAQVAKQVQTEEVVH